jgi:hypothetical protein
MLNCMSQLHVASYEYFLIKIKIKVKIINSFYNRSIPLHLIKIVTSNFLMGPLSAIFGGVGVFV